MDNSKMVSLQSTMLSISNDCFVPIKVSWKSLIKKTLFKRVSFRPVSQNMLLSKWNT